MGKIADAVAAVILILFAVIMLDKLGITLDDLYNDIKTFIYGSKPSFILFRWLIVHKC